MKSKATLFLSISAGLLSLVLFAVFIANFINSSQKKELLDTKNEDWVHAVITELGQIKLQTTHSEEHFKKDIFVIKNKHSLDDYQKLFEQYFKENKVRFRHKLRQENNEDILSILFEDDNGLLRILELKKIKKGLLVYNKKNNTHPYKIPDQGIKKSEPVKKTSYSDAHPSVISIVIDDAGITDEYEDAFLNYPFELTYAVIPFELYSHRFAEKARALGKEVIIHAPMEGSDKVHHDYGIKIQDSQENIEKQLLSYLKEVPGAIGLNNHRGSKATENKEFMKRFLNIYKKTKLFFLDSRTSPHSVAYSYATDLNIPSVERDIFLDHHDDEQYITNQVFELIKLGRTKKGAVGIAHCTKAVTLKVLKKFIPYFKEHNVKLIPLSEVVKRKYYVSLRN